MLRDDTTEPTPADPTPKPTGASAPSNADAPLDPAIERVRARLARLMLLGIGTLLLGVLAIVIVAFYRGGGEPSTVGGGDVTLPVLPGATLEDASLAPNGLLLRFAMPDGTTQLVVLDPASGAPRLRVTLDDAATQNAAAD